MLFRRTSIGIALAAIISIEPLAPVPVPTARLATLLASLSAAVRSSKSSTKWSGTLRERGA